MDCAHIVVKLSMYSEEREKLKRLTKKLTGIKWNSPSNLNKDHTSGQEMAEMHNLQAANKYHRGNCFNVRENERKKA